MKLLFSIVACASLLTFPAWACRGTAEYSQVRAQLTKADLPAADKAVYEKRLYEGWALHERGHTQDDKELRKQSLAILDKIKSKVGI